MKTVINKIKISAFVVITILVNSCSAQNEILDSKECGVKSDLVELMKGELKNHHLVVDGKVLNESYFKNKSYSLKEFLKPEALTLMRKIKIENQNDIIDLTNFFEAEDYDYMKCQLAKTNIENWKQILPKDYFKQSDSIGEILAEYKSLKDIYNDENYKEILSLMNKRLYYSIPLFDKKHKHALVYRETNSSGDLYILNKQNGSWVYFARSPVWIE